MKKINIDKVIKEAEFSVQKKTGGWEGWNIYVRHPLFSKKSFTYMGDKKPRLTAKRKKVMVERAIACKKAEEHNYEIFQKQRSPNWRMWHAGEDFIIAMFKNEKVFECVRDALISNSEFTEFNIALQRLLDSKACADEYRELSMQKLPHPSREIE